jgi:NitT/TauT family transport system substrate-binding protein
MIKKLNPDMTDGQIAYSTAKLKEYGILESGVALQLGIGCMTDERVKAIYDSLSKAKVVSPGLDLATVFKTNLACKKVGMNLKR